MAEFNLSEKECEVLPDSAPMYHRGAVKEFIKRDLELLVGLKRGTMGWEEYSERKQELIGNKLAGEKLK